MSRITPIACGLALPLTLFAQTALADLTPAQVWADWRQYMEGVGYQIEGTESTNGANLTVSGINLNFKAPDGGGDMTMSLGTIDFNANGDGTVAVVLPDSLPIAFEGKSGFGETISVTVNVTQTGHAMIASGSPENLTYDYSAGRLQIDVDQSATSSTGAAVDASKVSFNGTNVRNTTTMAIGDLRTYDQVSSIESAAYTVNVVGEGGNAETVNISGVVSRINVNGNGTMPKDPTPGGDMEALMAAGFDITGKFTYATGASEFDVKDPNGGNFKMQTTSQGGGLDVAIGAGGIAYSGAQRDLKMTANVDAMPFPIEMAMAESGFNLAVPVQKADTAQDFALGINMGNFTMSDVLWGLFDPSAQLPRDPATIKLDFTGTAKVLVDLMIPQNVTNIAGPQATVETLKLNTLLVDLAGAKLEGTGGLSFDGSGPSIVPGVGTPVGALNFALAGGNGLLDKLTGIGLLPQEQAMGARMMMGIFAIPGDAPDTLNSKIEFTQDGQILANGQRIR